MGFELHLEAGDGSAQRIVLGEGRTVVAAQPAARYRLVASDDAVLDGASVRRFGNDLVVQGLPEGRELELDNFFGACRPLAECSFALDPLGAPAGAVLTSQADPLAALRDGSFLLYGTADGETTAVVVPTSAAAAGESPLGTIGTLGAGLLAVGALAGAAGGGSGGGNGSATVVASGSLPAPGTAPPAAGASPSTDPGLQPSTEPGTSGPAQPETPAPPEPETPAPPPPPSPPPPAPLPGLASFTLFDDRGRDTGPIADGGRTDDRSPRVTLVLDDVLGSEQTLTLRLGDDTSRILTEGSVLDFEEARLARGPHSYTAQITDGSGNVTTLDLNGALDGTAFTIVVI
jgi:hypothetical protein